MGDCKDQMRKTAKNPKEKKSKKKFKRSNEELAETVADCIDRAYLKTQKLVRRKNADISLEPGRELYNARQYSRLQQIERLLEMCADIAYEYGQDS